MTYVIASFCTKLYDRLCCSKVQTARCAKRLRRSPDKTPTTRTSNDPMKRQHPIPSPPPDTEARTIEAMVQITCHAKHGTKRELCSECQELLDYALLRLEKCPFQELKSTCVNCQVHCYRAEIARTHSAGHALRRPAHGLSPSLSGLHAFGRRQPARGPRTAQAARQRIVGNSSLPCKPSFCVVSP